MAHQSTVSVIIPCYNGARFIRQTLESALAQTRPALEVIVIDDGSTDESAKIAESFGPPVRVLKQENQGESVARNWGIREAKGEYIQFLDADDLLDPDTLKIQLENIQDVPGGVACMGCSHFEEDPGKPFFVEGPRSDDFFPRIIEMNLNPPHCWLTPKRIVEQAGCFHEPLRYFEDWDFWWRVGMTGATFVPVQFVGAHYRRHRHSQMVTTPDVERAMGHACLMERMCRAFLDRDEMLQEHGDTLFWSALTAYHRARVAGAGRSRLASLAEALEEAAKKGPETVTGSRFARLIGLVGLHKAEWLRSLFLRDNRKDWTYETQFPTEESEQSGKPKAESG